MGGWISSKDQVPEEGKVVIVEGGIAYRSGCGWFTIKGEEWPGKIIQWPVEFWQPIPAPPGPIAEAETTGSRVSEAEKENN